MSLYFGGFYACVIAYSCAKCLGNSWASELFTCESMMLGQGIEAARMQILCIKLLWTGQQSF